MEVGNDAAGDFNDMGGIGKWLLSMEGRQGSQKPDRLREASYTSGWRYIYSIWIGFIRLFIVKIPYRTVLAKYNTLLVVRGPHRRTHSSYLLERVQTFGPKLCPLGGSKFREIVGATEISPWVNKPMSTLSSLWARDTH